MSASGVGLSSPKDSSLLATRTAAIGEKYRRVLVIMPIRGMRVVIRGLVDISRDEPPRARIGFSIMLLNGLPSARRGRAGLLRLWMLDLGSFDSGRPIQAAFEGFKLIAATRTANSTQAQVDFILGCCGCD